MRMASAVLWDDEPQPGLSGSAERAPRPAPAGRPASTGQPAAHHRLGTLRAAAREAPQPWLRSPFSGHISARRTVAFTTAGLDALHRAAHAVDGATLNDAVLTVVAGGLRRWLERRHGRLDAIRVKVPVSLHGPAPSAGGDNAGPGNRDSFFCLDLPLWPADPRQRLAAVRRATRARKDGHDAQQLDALMRELGRTPRLRDFADRVLAHPRSFALNVSNVPGPARPVQVLGVPVHALYSLAEIGDQHALRVAVVSLAGTLHFGLVADPTLLDGIDQLAADMRAEAADLTGGHLPPA
jgi:hypothetical protein